MIKSKMTILILIIAVISTANNCGYKVSGSYATLTNGVRSLGIPVLKNHLPQIPIEVRLTQSLIREFSERTKLAISSNASGVDAVFQGEISWISAAPIGFSREKFGSIYVVAIHLKARVVDLRTNRIIFQNDSMVFKDEYVVNSNVTQFFSEENLAFDRMAKDFAATAVASVFANF